MFDEEPSPSPSPQPKLQTQRYSIGYAMQPNKLQNLHPTSLLSYTNQHGIDLIPIDTTKPLTQQGPFHCIIHKLHPQDWTQLHLNEYMNKNPHGIIIDPPQLVHKLHNRVSMLEPMTHLKISLENTTIGVPNQLLIERKMFHQEQGMSLSLSFPVIAKPLYADGTANSHELCVVFDQEGLRRTLDNNNIDQNPMVLQEFVNHGGVVFKVYVAGEHVRCVKRRSLPDISEEKVKMLKGMLKFSQISNLTLQADDDEGDGDGDVMRNMIEKAEMPPQSLITELARGLREAMGLNLFNVDVIRDVRDCDRYFVIDINYFPAYAKLPSYQSFITDFLLDCVTRTKKEEKVGKS